VSFAGAYWFLFSGILQIFCYYYYYCVSICTSLSVCLSVQVSGVITDSAGVVRYVLSGTWDAKMEGANVLNGDDANLGKVEYITGPSKVLWQRRFPPYVIAASNSVVKL